ncbi:MAG: alpha-mannosidase, partial [Clostridiales bacterium]|nr:alpha-mannosidase [Clostridiales bacterium]
MELSSVAKNFRLLCVAHAHIDMNWMWGYAETVAVTLDTFRTMLNLMNEYPDFKFSQSQASVYRIVEEFDPHMLQEIKKCVKEKRWEVTASTWVEADKNMPNGESLARHVLYTKKYLSELLDLDPDSLQLDFEPDTFGHSRNVPEVLSKAGVKYYYHCRGYKGHNLYRWKSPSGSSVITYREPLWYNATIDSDIAVVVPEFCADNNMKTMLKVYGVGDHGGGPTRRDLEKLIEMSTWPIYPTIQFGTFSEFYASVEEEIGDKLPVVDAELNSVFSGCYTTQTRIKQSNRIGEAKLYDAEAYSTLNALFVNGEYPSKAYEEAWRKVLFNQFHDIITGSCVIDTREHAMGQFQQVLATANTGYIQA